MRYTNTFSKGKFAVYRNVFALIVAIDDYEGETRFQSKHATYKEIQAWVKKNYGLHVSNLAISWTKDLCGLAKTKQKEIMGAHGRYAGDLTPEKADAIREALIRFGILKNESPEEETVAWQRPFLRYNKALCREAGKFSKHLSL